MSKLLGRYQEQEILKQALQSAKSELIAIYGRRRIGKTYLVRQVYKSYIQFEITGLHDATLADQLENFHLTLSQKGMNTPKPKSWLDAFQQLSQYIDSLTSRKKKVFFIDEFPWFATRRSKFLMAFENFWNSYASKRKDLVVVICGSAASYMVQKIIRNKGGLHNRLTEQIRVLPFQLAETREFLKSKGIRYTNYDTLRLYMAIGGIPHYLEKLQKGESVDQAIDRLCFEKDAPLRTEFKDVFASLFHYYEQHSKVVRALSSARNGLTRQEVAKKCNIKTGGRLTTTLVELEESGFIEAYHAFRKIKKNARYRLNDEYSMFYLKFIEKSVAKGKGTWLTKMSGQSYHSWAGFSFEMVCLKHIGQIKDSLGVSAVDTEFYSWAGQGKDQGAQIDLLIDRADNVINVCEMKFYRGEFAINKKYAGELRNKLNVFGESTNTEKNLFLTMITSYGVKENQYSLELVQNQMTIDQLFTYL